MWCTTICWNDYSMNTTVYWLKHDFFCYILVLWPREDYSLLLSHILISLKLKITLSQSCWEFFRWNNKWIGSCWAILSSKILIYISLSIPSHCSQRRRRVLVVVVMMISSSRIPWKYQTSSLPPSFTLIPEIILV